MFNKHLAMKTANPTGYQVPSVLRDCCKAFFLGKCHVTYLLLFLCMAHGSWFTAQAQTCSALSGIVNTYAPVTAIAGNVATIGATSGAAAPFAVGDNVVLIQMTGIPPVHTGSDMGKYELRTVTAVSGSNITLSSITNTYTTSTEKVQLVRAPKCATGTVSATVTAKVWDGTTGGIIALSGGTLTLNADIDATGTGFSQTNPPTTTVTTSLSSGQGSTDGRGLNDPNITYGGGGGGGSGGGGGTGGGGPSGGNNTPEYGGGGGGGGVSGGGGGGGATDYQHKGGQGGGSGGGGQGGGTGFNSYEPTEPGLNGGKGRFNDGSGSGGGGGIFGGGGGGGGNSYYGKSGGGGGGGTGGIGNGGNATYNDAGAGAGGGSYGGGGGGASSFAGGDDGYGGGGGGSWTGGGISGKGGSIYPQAAGNGNAIMATIITNSAHYMNTIQPRLMMGGAGGKSYCGTEGYGGGIVIINVNSLNGSNFKVISNGESKGLVSACLPLNSTWGTGAPGGGGGGQVVLKVINFTTQTLIEAKGGKGGDPLDGTWHGGSAGAGGGGGGIWLYGTTTTSNTGGQSVSISNTNISSLATATAAVAGGASGIDANNPKNNLRTSTGGAGGNGLVVASPDTPGWPVACAIDPIATVTNATCNTGASSTSTADDYITFSLNVTGTGTAATYTIATGLTPTSGTYSSSTSFSTAGGTAGTGNKTFTITDATDSACTQTVTVNDPGTCSTPASVNLSLAKTADRSTAVSGNTIIYTLTLTNSSSTNATGVVVTDLLPGGVTYVECSTTGSFPDGACTSAVYNSGTGIWTAGTVSGNGTKALKIKVTAN